MTQRGSKPQPITVKELIEHLRKLARLTGAEKAKLGRWLASGDGPTIATIQALADEGVVEEKAATRMTNAALARHLGYGSRSGITEAISRHNARLAGRS